VPEANVPVVVVGGGISGLSASYDLTRAGIPPTIFDKRGRAGGVIETRVTEGCTLECGPDSFITQKPEALALIEELGLGSEVIGSNDRERRTYIWKHDRLVRLPEGVMMIVPSKVMPMLKSPLLGWGTKIRMGLEYFRKPVESSGIDRSVADFVTDHFGRETLDYLALCSPVFMAAIPHASVSRASYPGFCRWRRPTAAWSVECLRRGKTRGRAPVRLRRCFRLCEAV